MPGSHPGRGTTLESSPTATSGHWERLRAGLAPSERGATTPQITRFSASVDAPGSHQEHEHDRQNGGEDEHPPSYACSLSTARHRGEQGRIARRGHGPDPRSRRVEHVSGDGLVVAVALHGERAVARVADRVAPAASEQTGAPRHRHHDGDPVLAQAGDLCVLVNAGHEEHDHEDGQRHETAGPDHAARRRASTSTPAPRSFDTDSPGGPLVSRSCPRRRAVVLGRSGDRSDTI